MGAGVNVHPFSRLRAVLTVVRAFPCRSRLGDAETAATVEEEVRGHMATGAFVAGWGRGPQAGAHTAVLATASGRLAPCRHSARVQIATCELQSPHL